MARLKSIALTAAILAAASAPCTIAPRLAAAETHVHLASSEEDAARRRAALDELFLRLKRAESPPEADALAAGIWRLWMQSGRPDIDLLMTAAVAEMGAANFGAALMILDEVVAQAPEWAEGWNKRATVHYLMQQLDRSLADIDKVLALEPRHFGALSGQGLCRMAKRNLEGALESFKRAIAIHPHLRERTEIVPRLEERLGKPI
jgi:tetratricopeptide (TPR) repeat protein